MVTRLWVTISARGNEEVPDGQAAALRAMLHSMQPQDSVLGTDQATQEPVLWGQVDGVGYLAHVPTWRDVGNGPAQLPHERAVRGEQLRQPEVRDLNREATRVAGGGLKQDEQHVFHQANDESRNAKHV